MTTPTATTTRFTAIIHREEGGYVALCAEADVASQGDTLEEAKAMLAEALELWLEDATAEELLDRIDYETVIVPIEVTGLGSDAAPTVKVDDVSAPAVTIG